MHDGDDWGDADGDGGAGGAARRKVHDGDDWGDADGDGHGGSTAVLSPSAVETPNMPWRFPFAFEPAHIRFYGRDNRPCPSPAGSEARAYAELLRRGEIGGGVAEARRRAGRRTPRRARREWVHSCCCSALLKEAAVCGMERRSVAVGRLC